MGLDAIEQAARAWLITATALDSGKVILADQDGTQPARPYLVVRVGGPQRVGGEDAVSHNYDAGRPAGQELEFVTRGERELVVSVQAFTVAPRGDSGAVALLARALDALALPSVREAMQAAGLVPFDPGEVRNLAEINGAKFVGRAILEVRCYTTASLSERTTFIETVEQEAEFGDP